MSAPTRRAVFSLYKEALRVCSRFDDPLVKRKVSMGRGDNATDAGERERALCDPQEGSG